MAEKLNMSPSGYSKIERGEKTSYSSANQNC
ncbi:MAG: XRE family transcriptional regulator [Methylococcales bacterium]|nr:XRE family transcriptional regulator [Methylococcales bacterium]